jgi:ABC-2 type transport system permease protein
VFSTLFRWELRSLRRDPACWLGLALALAALAFALLNGTRWRAHLERVQSAAASADTRARTEARALAARLDAMPDPAVTAFRDPRDPSGYANRQMAHFATLPATPLAALSTGQSDLLPSVIPLSPGADPALAGSTEPENPHRLLLGRFDAAFVVVHLAPLLIIALTYALVAGERERGTLALLLAQPLSLRALLLGRLAPRVLLATALLATLAAAFLLLSPSSPLSVSPSSSSRLALWLATAAAYGAFWFALAVAVAVRPGSAAKHALALVALWLGFVVLAPAAINLAVKTLARVPSRLDLVLAMRTATDAASADRSKVLAAFYEDHPELAPKGTAAAEDFTLLRVATTARVERDLAPVLARYEEQLARQQSLVARLALLSPALLAHTALAEAAGTGLARHRDFFRQAVAHHGELRAFFHPRIARKEKFTAYDAVPAFRHTDESAATVATRVGPALVALLLAAAALAAGASRSLRRATA